MCSTYGNLKQLYLVCFKGLSVLTQTMETDAAVFLAADCGRFVRRISMRQLLRELSVQHPAVT
ncbi:hypothetical protein J6590_068672 [Homalodisca vitripennis]|nr:hypothetical protein J6590_068672 [Homalodisca vitripennis]